MSSLALKVLLERLSTQKEGGTFDNKALKKAVAYKQTHTLLIEKESLIREFVTTLTDQYRLTPEEQKEVAGSVERSWPKLVSSAQSTLKSTKDIDVVIEPGRIILMYYGNKSNYYRIDDQFFKSDAKYASLFAPMLNSLKFYLVARTKRRILPRKDKQGNVVTENGKPVEAFGISDLFNQGHYQGSSIHYTLASQFLPQENDPTNYLDNTDIMKVITTSGIGVAPYNTDVNMLMEAASKITGGAKPSDGDFKKTITVKIEAKAENQRRGATEEANIRSEFVRHIRSVMNNKNFEWVNQESSDSAMQIVEKTLINTAIARGAKGKKQAIDTKDGHARLVDKIKIKSTATKLKVKGKGRPQTQQRERIQAIPSYLSLMTLINQRLPPKVRSNMGSPRLNNVTGRLSESARVTNITPTAQGFPSIEYTYARSPYDVFDKRLGAAPWNEPARDPSTLIAMSVRQLAQELGMRRFFTRRAA